MLLPTMRSPHKSTSANDTNLSHNPYDLESLLVRHRVGWIELLAPGAQGWDGPIVQR